MKRLLVLLVVFLLLGCSRVQIFYNQLDWTLPLYVESYFDFTDSQHISLKREVKLLLKWHCGTQLFLYSSLLTRANADFQAGLITPERLNDYTNALENYWKSILHEASPGIAQILATIDEHQVQQLFDGFSIKNRNIEKEYTNRSREELEIDYKVRMIEELERWFGPLTSNQEQAVTDWSRTFTSLGELGLENRRQWQAKLWSLLEQRQDIAVFTTGIMGLLRNREIFRSTAYQNRLEHNRQVTIELVVRIGTLLNDLQRAHLDKELSSVIMDLDALACIPETTQR